MFAACDDRTPAAQPEPAESETAPSPTPTPTTSPTPEASPSPSPTVPPEEGGLLRVAIPQPATLDPMRAQDPGSVLIVRQLFEGLARWDPVAEQVVPAAAKSWEISDEGRRFTFQLRKGLRWHDGSPVTAADFKAAFDRIAVRDNASDLAYTLERVEGFIRTNQLGRGRHLSGVQAPDDSTLVIELTQPYYDWPAVLTHPGLVPIPEQATDAPDKFVSKPIGNGPFRMDEAWTSGEPVVLRAFDDSAADPHLDRIEFTTFEDAGASWPSFEEGDVDVAEVPVGRFDSAAETYGGGVTPLLAGYYFGMNLRAKSMASERVRRAISLAIDRESIATDVYKGSMEPPRGVVPTGMPGFTDDACGSVCGYRPDRAEAIVSALKEKAARIDLEFTKGDPHGRVAASVADDLRAVGLRVKVRGFSFPAYVQRLGGPEQDVFRYGWLAEYPSPDAFLSPLFDSASADNHSHFDSPRVDRLLDEAHATRAESKRLQLYRAAERAILKGVAVAPIGSFVSHWAARPEVQGIVFDVFGGFDAAGVSLSD
jgi:oligopeptide transport system substrate-binding protein